MKKGKFQKRSAFPKGLAVLMALVLLIGAAVGGTVAWLTSTSDEVTNTFTTSDISIKLKETENTLDGDGNENTNSYQMIPGHTITKDPEVTVVANSEDCFLYVKVVESTNFDTFMEYEMADGWIVLDATNYPGVYYREVAKNATSHQFFYVIKDNQVTVKSGVTKSDMVTAADNLPTLKVTAYAIQKYNTNKGTTWSAAEAWTKIGT